jgi:hypothetical protein
MNGSDQPKQNKWLTKRLLRLYAIVSFFCAVLTLILCAKVYFRETFLEPGAAINSQAVEGMVGMIRATFFGIMPGTSVLLIVGSLLLWACSRKFYTKLDK